MSENGIGYMTIGGHQFPLDGLRLTGGGIEVSFTIKGPLPAFGGHLTLFGEDGQGIMQGHEAMIGEVGTEETLKCTHTLRLSNIESYGMRREY